MKTKKLQSIRDELNAVKKELENISALQMAIELGYRSPNTIIHWIKNKRIPPNAKPKVRAYFLRKAS